MDGSVRKTRPVNPRTHASPVSIAFFGYTLPTFFTAYTRDLDMSDIPETYDSHKSAMLGDKMEKAWMKEEIKAKKANRQPSLMRVLIKVHWKEFLFYGLVFAVAEFAIRIPQPIFLGKLIMYFTPPDAEGNHPPDNADNITKRQAYFYACGVVGSSLFNVLIVNPYMMGIVHLGMKIRVGCCSLIYRKSLRLSKRALGQTTIGQLVNLLSNDVNRFDNSVIFAHLLWIGPAETGIITYLMYLEVGMSALIGVVFLLVLIPLQIYLGTRTSTLRLRTAVRTDERIRLMSEIISGIQVIKMYTWESPFASLVSNARKYEVESVRNASYIRGILFSFIMYSVRISIFITVLSYVLLGERITAEKVFVLTSFYGLLRQSMTLFVPLAIGYLAEANVSVERLNKFMMFEENKLVAIGRKSAPVVLETGPYKLYRTESEEEIEATYKDNNKGIVLKNVTAKWNLSSIENTLHDITLMVEPSKVMAIIGNVGSGKSSILKAILKELPLSSGFIHVYGEISYAAQEPWLFTGTIRQNILFGLPMDRIRYKLVVKNCALKRDFQLFPYGDKTIVGERGVALSGGQRARISLARAVYKPADVYLLDDPLSAVDTHVGKKLFKNCITGFLKEKCVILITHQLQYLKELDHIIVMHNGAVVAQGNYDALRASAIDLEGMLKEPAEILDEPPPQKQNSKTSIDSEETDAPVEAEEQKTSGKVGCYVYKSYFAAGGNCCIVSGVFLLFFFAQLAGSGGDYFITHWVNMEQMSYVDRTSNPIESDNTGGSFWNMNRNMCIYIYSSITIATVVLVLVRSFAFFAFCMRASIRLHDWMFRSISRAPMRFFNTNSSGRILNRFSKDIGAIDELLPIAFIDFLQIGITLLGITTVVAIVNPYLAIPTIILGFICYLLRIFYVPTGRSTKRLEGVARSPVFSHLSASLQGLTTIRAFKAQTILEREFDVHQDLHSAAYYMFLSTATAFGFWLDTICVVYIASVTFSFLVLGEEHMGGNVGLAITQSVALTGMLQWGIRQSTEIVNQMTSVERVLEYSNLAPERELQTSEKHKPPPDWPQDGEIKFVDVFLRYTPQDAPVLKNLNFTIDPRAKVGIVGRTGAGKSSLITALFQLTETEGSILIDDVDTKTLGLHDLRSKISIIPQEPFLFSGTMRKNLDPFDEYNDEVLWRALEGVELKEAVMDLTEGLNSQISEGGDNFSAGQRQLVCLARAIIRNNKILVLDEATANVDPHTDALIQTTIRKKFADCTVLTIAHRLHTVMDSDRVLVMDAGTMVEFDHPAVLLTNTSGIFYGMVMQTGKSMAEKLIKIAKLHYGEQLRTRSSSKCTLQ